MFPRPSSTRSRSAYLRRISCKTPGKSNKSQSCSSWKVGNLHLTAVALLQVPIKGERWYLRRFDGSQQDVACRLQALAVRRSAWVLLPVLLRHVLRVLRFDLEFRSHLLLLHLPDIHLYHPSPEIFYPTMTHLGFQSKFCSKSSFVRGVSLMLASLKEISLSALALLLYWTHLSLVPNFLFPKSPGWAECRCWEELVVDPQVLATPVAIQPVWWSSWWWLKTWWWWWWWWWSWWWW